MILIAPKMLLNLLRVYVITLSFFEPNLADLFLLKFAGMAYQFQIRAFVSECIFDCKFS